MPKQTHVLIAGGGVAALEAALALREIAAELVHVELLSPADRFSYRPLAVTLPFGGAEVGGFELAELAAEFGASVTKGALTGIDAWRHRAYTSTNREIEYDVLLIACGALPMPSVAGAITFRGSSDADDVHHVLEELARGEARSLAFIVPWGEAWPLPAYDLALLAGTHAPRGSELWLVTPEKQPLQLFGRPASEAVHELLAARGVMLRTDAVAERFEAGLLELVADTPLEVERAVALPRLVGAPIDGIPQTIDGFVPTDEHGRVEGIADVFAAGDITSFPVKHGGLATQQALAAVETIAASAGADVVPRPFRPVVHGLLLTGSEPRFLRRELHGTGETEPVVTSEPLWWPPAKIAGKHLGPFLARLEGTVAPPEPPEGARTVEVPLESDVLQRLDVGRVPELDDELEDEFEPGAVSSIEVCEVAPEDTLGEVAERLVRSSLSAVVVSEYGNLIGILTIRDLIAAFAARVHPSEARARQWMTAKPIVLRTGSSRAGAAALMRAHGIHHLPLVEDGKPVGMLRLDEDAVGALPIGLGL